MVIYHAIGVRHIRWNISRSQSYGLIGVGTHITTKNRSFWALFGVPESDIHSPNLPMVIYHATGVRHIRWNISRNLKPLQWLIPGLFGARRLRELRDAIRAVYESKIVIFCMNATFPSQWMAKYLRTHTKFFRPLIYPFLAYFGPFSGSQRLIITHQTSQWSYIMPMGSDTSVGTFPGIHHMGS